jgi:hypothetical protein
MIKNQKSNRVDDLQYMRVQILQHMNLFEDNLFDKVQEYILYYMTPYYDKIKSIVEPMESL